MFIRFKRQRHKVVKHTQTILRACNFFIKETLEQLFSCEFCEISKSNFFYRTPPVLLLENVINARIQIHEAKKA